MTTKFPALVAACRAGVVIALGILPTISCGTAVRPTASQPFPEFSFVAIPRSDLKVGARVVGGEIVGDGVDPSLLVVQRSLSSSVVDNSSVSRAAVRASLLNLFGLSAEVANENNFRVEFSGVETVKLKSPTVLEPIPDAEYIYAGLRVKDLVISADESLISEISANATVSAASFEVAANPVNGRSSLRQTGEELYVGVRKIRFKSVQLRSYKTHIGRPGFGERVFEAGAIVTGSAWKLVAEFVASPIRTCLDSEFSEQVAEICRVPMRDLFPGETIYMDPDSDSEFFASNPDEASVRLYHEDCNDTYRVVFRDLEAAQEIVGERSFDYFKGSSWEYPLPVRLTEDAITVASVACNEFYYHVTQAPLGEGELMCNGGPAPHGTVVLSEKTYPFEFIPSDTAQ